MKRYNITVNGSVYDVMVEEADGIPVSVQVPVSAPIQVQTAKPAPVTSSQSAQGSVKVEAPMPGNIVSMKVRESERVDNNTVIAILEAMKMENDIVAPCAGVIMSINVKDGDTVNTGTVIATMNP